MHNELLLGVMLIYTELEWKWERGILETWLDSKFTLTLQVEFYLPKVSQNSLHDNHKNFDADNHPIKRDMQVSRIAMVSNDKKN